nr:MAG TPA: hypothetical protein [Caudoviricetes sp.]DAY48015.1 MAG TPA: hypothetical protein [Caudoviricetes sp.]
MCSSYGKRHLRLRKCLFLFKSLNLFPFRYLNYLLITYG